MAATRFYAASIKIFEIFGFRQHYTDVCTNGNHLKPVVSSCFKYHWTHSMISHFRWKHGVFRSIHTSVIRSWLGAPRNTARKTTLVTLFPVSKEKIRKESDRVSKFSALLGLTTYTMLPTPLFSLCRWTFAQNVGSFSFHLVLTRCFTVSMPGHSSFTKKIVVPSVTWNKTQINCRDCLLTNSMEMTFLTEYDQSSSRKGIVWYKRKNK